MFLKALTVATVVALSVTGTASATYNSDRNHTSYWGNNCTKTEIKGEVMTYTAPEGATKVIVKGGTTNKVYTTAPFINLTAEVNPKSGKTYAISHVIVCTDKATPVAQPTKTENKKPTVTHTVKKTVGAKGGGETVTPVAATTMPERDTLVAAGAGMNTMFIAAALATIAGYLAHRKFLAREVVRVSDC